MTASHKRNTTDRDITWRSPSVKCFACHDSGIVCNGDGLLNDYLADYDTNANGERHGGIDLAVICHCEAAYPSLNPDGSTARGGFRSGGDPIAVATENGNQAVGISIDKFSAREIHSRRLRRWQEAEIEMNDLRRRAAAGETVTAPDYITSVKQQLQGLKNMFELPRPTPSS